MTDKNCDIWSEEQRDWINIPIFKIAHKVNDSLDRFTDYRVTFDSSKGIAISRFEVFPYEEETVKQPSYMLIREYKEQLLPGNMNTADRWKYSHAHNLWFRETTSKDLDQFIENLLSEEFERSRETSEHELYKDPIQFSKAIGELLRDISIYNRMKYNPYDRLNLERLFW
ncbi:hypothetical protein HYU07_01240 [Candidatus Woesearchaeota archaeon]|nr:hypothetical protein [Candidatus Woesearchaeota archaeon]